MTRLNTGQRGQPRNSNSPDLLMLSVVPSPPAYFDAARSAVWQTVGETLVARGDLAEGDLGALEIYANSTVEYRQAVAILMEEGLTILNAGGAPAPHPASILKKGAETRHPGPHRRVRPHRDRPRSRWKL